MSVFDQVKYSSISQDTLDSFAKKFKEIQKEITMCFHASRETSLAVTNLQQAFQWLETAVKDAQIKTQAAHDQHEADLFKSGKYGTVIEVQDRAFDTFEEAKARVTELEGQGKVAGVVELGVETDEKGNPV